MERVREAAPVVRSDVPQGSVAITLTAHAVRAGVGFGTGIGAPKRQLASSWQLPTPPPQSASAAQRPLPSVPGLPFTQWRSGPAPRVQFAGPVPRLAASPNDRPLTVDTSSRL